MDYGTFFFICILVNFDEGIICGDWCIIGLGISLLGANANIAPSWLKILCLLARLMCPLVHLSVSPHHHNHSFSLSHPIRHQLAIHSEQDIITSSWDETRQNTTNKNIYITISENYYYWLIFHFVYLFFIIYSEFVVFPTLVSLNLSQSQIYSLNIFTFVFINLN